MRKPNSILRAAALLMLAAAAALASFGCSTKSTVGPSADYPAPQPNSPANALKRIEWDWQRRDPHYLNMLTDDFRFTFAAGDSGGGQWSQTPWDRLVESTAISAMFGTGSMPPRLVSITFSLDRDFVTLPDPRPGKDPRWHKSVRSHVACVAELDLGGGVSRKNASGSALFFLVRGDSAAIPPDLFERGFRPDSTVWWLERWEDETLVAGLRPTPIQVVTLGHLKSLFLPLPRRSAL